MSNKIIHGSSEISKLVIGNNLNINNYGINIYLGEAYVTTLNLLSNKECEEKVKNKMGVWPDQHLWSTIGYDTYVYYGGGSPAYTVNRKTGEVLFNEQSIDFVYDINIAIKCVEYMCCCDGCYKVIPAVTRGGPRDTYKLTRIDLLNGNRTNYEVGIDGRVWEL